MDRRDYDPFAPHDEKPAGVEHRSSVKTPAASESARTEGTGKAKSKAASKPKAKAAKRKPAAKKAKAKAAK